MKRNQINRTYHASSIFNPINLAQFTIISLYSRKVHNTTVIGKSKASILLQIDLCTQSFPSATM